MVVYDTYINSQRSYYATLMWICLYIYGLYCIYIYQHIIYTVYTHSKILYIYTHQLITHRIVYIYIYQHIIYTHNKNTIYMIYVHLPSHYRDAPKILDLSPRTDWRQIASSAKRLDLSGDRPWYSLRSSMDGPFKLVKAMVTWGFRIPHVFLGNHHITYITFKSRFQLGGSIEDYIS